MQKEEFSLKETNPLLGGGRAAAGGGGGGDATKLTTTHDLVEQSDYLYVRIVKAKDLPGKDVTGGCDPYVEVKLGNYKGSTRHFEKKTDPEWNQIFAVPKDRIQTSQLEITVRDKDVVKDDLLGRVGFDLGEVPKRAPPDSPLAPQWYRLENKKNLKAKGELMLAVWFGTQADEAFPVALHMDAAAAAGGPDGLVAAGSKVYLSPRLWYVRVNVIEAQDLQPGEPGRAPAVYVRAVLGNQSLRTKVSETKTVNPAWNEDLLFVAAEPFEELLILSVEDRDTGETLGRCALPLQYVGKRSDHKPAGSRWCNLEKQFGLVEGPDGRANGKFASRLHMRICLDGGYHVLDESTHYSSDYKPTAKVLWKNSIGVLELGILGAHGLPPMKAKEDRATTDAYVVAKYGSKWVRTRTIMDTTSPKWNEQYTWDVWDPCTVITIGVFDNGFDGGDSKIGKVRIRLSTLETDRVYTHAYPLLVLKPSGVKKTGEVHLAVRFTCSSLVNMMHMYTKPLLPKMHYVHPLSSGQLENLRHQAIEITCMKLGRTEPPLKKEVVVYMLDVGSSLWSMRRSKANFFRVMGVLGGSIAVAKWVGSVCLWKNPVTTVLIHVLFLILVMYPELILPTAFLYLFLIGVWYYRWRPRHPPNMDTRLSYADVASPEELDEEFDSFPTSRSGDVAKMRYDRLRAIAGRIQTVVGDVAAQGERVQSLLSWRDPRATGIFVVLCLVAAAVVYVVPFRLVVLLAGFYAMRHPRFRPKLPSPALNYYRRLPSKTDCLL